MGRLHAFAEALKESFVIRDPLHTTEAIDQDLVPPHVGRPEVSIFQVISEFNFNQLPTQEILHILATSCIVVTDRAIQPLKFDAKGLSTLSTLSTVVPIQGIAILHVF